MWLDRILVRLEKMANEDGTGPRWRRMGVEDKKRRASEGRRRTVYGRTGFDCNVPVSRRRLPKGPAKQPARRQILS